MGLAQLNELKQDGATRPLVAELDGLIAQRRFDIHFQPIVDVQRIGILGFEALSRGPADSPLQSPLLLFALAADSGRLIELERVLVRLILARFQALELPGQLFLNLSADSLSVAAQQRGAIEQAIQQLGLPASRVVLELTETRPVLDPTALRHSIAAMRELGFRIALDDLGEGFASLKRWTELRPDFVKIDRHFIDGVASDPLKLQFVRSITEIASSSGSTVIAEGLEEEGDLRVLARLGIAVCQGYLLGRPSANPRPGLRAEVPALLHRSRALAAGEHAALAWGGELCAGQLARRGATVSAAVSCREVIEMFQRDPQLIAIPVLDAAQRPIGLLRSMTVFKRGSERYFGELFGRKSCTAMMDSQALVFDLSASLRQMSEAMAALDERQLVDGFIVTQDGQYFGSGRSSDLLKAVSDLQVQTARHANPLTLLPGNIAIDRHLDALLGSAQDFVVAYWDLSHFKAFNDVYGFAAGDDMIRSVAQVLRQASDAQLDFVGHIGGDDFVQVLASPDWAERLQGVADAFDQQAARLFAPEHVAAGGYPAQDRQGRDCFFPLPCLRAGALRVRPGDFPHARALATAMTGAKKLAKRLEGRSAYFLERRTLAATATG